MSDSLGLEHCTIESVTANSHAENRSTTTASTDNLCPGQSYLPSNVVTNTPGIDALDHKGELNYCIVRNFCRNKFSQIL